MDKVLVEEKQRLSMNQKEANDFAWYKERMESLSEHSTRSMPTANAGISDWKRMKVNYDLFNNIVDLEELKYVVSGFKGDLGKMPAKMKNRDIVSNKIKAIIGMEMARPFDYTIMAINKEASNRKTEAFKNKIKDFVQESIMLPIQQKAQMEVMASYQGRELTEQETQQVQEQIQANIQANTPDKIKEYMVRDYQDPSEIMHQQLLEYLSRDLDIKHIFSKGVKDAALVAKEFYWVGESRKKPAIMRVNPMRFNYDKSPEIDFIEDGEWASYEFRMTPSEIINFFAGELTNAEIDKIYSWAGPKGYAKNRPMFTAEDLFANGNEKGGVIMFDEDIADSNNTIRVFHGNWKALRKVCFLTYFDDEIGEELTTIVDESYVLQPELGDIDLTYEWLPEAYECWQIGDDIYKRMRPVPGQFKNMNDLYTCKLSYYGAVYDATNSTPTSIMDRGKDFQYYINALYYRLEMLVASDKGKKVLMNIGAIPSDAGIDIEQFQYFFESSPFGWVDFGEEGANYQDINTVAKMIDLSTASDMSKYIELINVIKAEVGDAMGVSRQMEAQFAERDAVRNTQQALIQNSYILEPFYSLHDKVKRNVLLAIINQAKITYAGYTEPIAYTLEDMSKHILELNDDYLFETIINLYIADNGKANEIKQTITQLAHAAVQSSTAKLSDIVAIMNETSVTSASNKLKESEIEAEERQNAMEEARNKAIKDAETIKAQAEQRKHQNKLEEINVEYDRKEDLEVIKGSFVGMSFNPDTDNDNDGVNDFLEIAREGLDADIKRSKEQREQDKFEFEKQKSRIDQRLKEKDLNLKEKALSVKNSKATEKKE